MIKLIMSIAVVLFSFASPKQSNEDANTRICFYSYVSGNYRVQVRNKQAVSTAYNITWPDGNTIGPYPTVPTGVTVYMYYTAPFQPGNLSVTPTVNCCTVSVYVSQQIGTKKCN